MKTNIALIGFMGTGKTAAGKVLAKKLSKKFVETDALIEQASGKSIPEIFQQDGEVAFRELEIGVIKEVAQKKNQVITCGGRDSPQQNKRRPPEAGSNTSLFDRFAPGNTEADIRQQGDKAPA